MQQGFYEYTDPIYVNRFEQNNPFRIVQAEMPEVIWLGWISCLALSGLSFASFYIVCQMWLWYFGLLRIRMIRLIKKFQRWSCLVCHHCLFVLPFVVVDVVCMCVCAYFRTMKAWIYCVCVVLSPSLIGTERGKQYLLSREADSEKRRATQETTRTKAQSAEK